MPDKEQFTVLVNQATGKPAPVIGGQVAWSSAVQFRVLTVGYSHQSKFKEHTFDNYILTVELIGDEPIADWLTRSLRKRNIHVRVIN